MGWLWDIHLCVYSCLVPSSFIMNGLGVRFYFLAEKLGYRTYNLSRCIIHTNCISIQPLHVYFKDKCIASSSNPLQGFILQVCIS